MTRKTQLVFAAALTFALIAMPASAGDYFIQEAGGEMAWSLTKSYGTAHLVVSGPDDFYFARTFSAGETPSFAVYDELGELADGGYSWTLTVTSKVDDSLRGEMEAARAAGDAAYLENLKARGLFSSNVHNGHFVKRNGSLIIPEMNPAAEGDADFALPTKDQVIADDLIVDGSACVGTDCASGENFGFDTIRLKENNVRIKFEDTSNASGSFPSTDWQLIANDSNNGGANRFSVEDVTDSKTPFTIEGGTPNNTLYVDSNGRIGVKTSSPVVDIHVVEGNTPTLRLEQDGSDGFTSQIWDLGGNETNFFLRDITNSSLLPFRVKPNAAKNSLFVDEEGRTGFGVTDSGPEQDLHLRSTDGDAQLLIEETNATVIQRVLLKLENTGIPSFQLEDTDSEDKWAFSVKNGGFEMSKGGSGVSEMFISEDGDLTITGSLTTAGDTYPDYVFRDGYELLSLDAVEAFIDANGHLPNVKSEEDVEYGRRINMTELSISLLEKVEELTLYAIGEHKTNRSQQQTIEMQNELIRQLEARLASLEATVR